MENGPPTPIIPYAGHTNKRRGWRMVMAMKAAGLLAGFSLATAILGSLVLAIATTPPKQLAFQFYDVLTYQLVFLILEIPVLIIAMFSCWIRLASTPCTPAKKRWIWPFAFTHGGVVVAVFLMPDGISNVEFVLYFECAALIWFLLVPAGSCFFLLKRNPADGSTLNRPSPTS